MTYEETLDWLYTQLPMYQRVGGAAYKADLTNTIKMCELLENPERELKCVHIAGTNGKGSTAHMTASMLQEAGYRTGLYTSPHLSDFRERIRINGKMISELEVMAFLALYKDDFASMGLSFFEMTVGMAFHHFSEHEVDIAVIETGLGGRLDSTNVVVPEVSVITSIGIDHTQFLGETIQEIAREKAGIIKEGVPVVVGDLVEDAMEVIESRAAFLKSSLITSAHPDWGFTTDLQGSYQQHNMNVALATIECLNARGWTIDTATITKGLANVIRNTGLLGRWQTLSKEPHTICDIGHNVDGIAQVIHNLGLTPHERLHFVLGMVDDKDHTAVLELLPKDAIYYFCAARIPRALNAEQLSAQAESHGLHGRVYDSVNEALDAAQTAAKKDDIVFVGGSTFVVAEVV